jgi:hypothetical protein
MKDFKKLIKEAHLGNPLNEVDRATRADKMLSGEYEDEDYKNSKRYDDVRADLEGEINEENEKWDKISKMEYGKPWMELSIAQKQELLSYMNRETEKQFQTDYERRRRETSDYMNEELKLGVKYELPTGETGYIMTGGSKDPKDWKFSANKEPYLSVKDKLKPTEKQPGKYDGVDFMNESVTPSTRVTYIASPAPRKMLAQELEDLFGDDYRNIVTEFQDDGGYESVLMFNLTDSDIERIEDEIGDVLIGEYSLKKVKDIQETLKEDINDPVLMRTRAAQMKRDAMDKKDLENKSKRISVDKAIDLRYELSILDREREDILMRIEDIGVEMDQTAEPEGGPIADKLGERLMAAERELRAIDRKIIDIKDDLGIFDMNESVNENTLDDFSIEDIDKSLVKKYGEDLIMFVIGIDELNKKEYLDPEYLDDRIQIHLEEPGIRQKFNYIPEGTCGYGEDGVIGDKPSGPDLNEESFDLDIDDAHSGDATLDRTVGKMGYNESLKKSLKESLNKRLGK